MKTRLDFVSNSSSCSFFIELDTQEAVDAFKSVVKELDLFEVSLTAYDGLDDVDGYSPTCIYKCLDGKVSIDKLINDLKVGSWVHCSTGDDHDPEFQERFDMLVDAVDNNKASYSFNIYEDLGAHTTHPNAMEFPL